MLAFAAAVLLLIGTPGPGVLSTAGVAAGFGPRPATRFVFGLFLGNNLVAVTVISGLAALILADPRVRIVLLGLSLLYICYLALRIALAGSKIGFIERSAPPGINGGILLQVINPKAYAVSTTLFTGFAFWPASYSVEVILKLLIFNLIWIPLHFVWLFMGLWLNRLDLSDRAQGAINIGMALSMLGVVVLAALTQIGA